MLKSPFPYFGGKSKVADAVWKRFGHTPNYVEPFFGSGAILLARPTTAGIETVNDIDCYLANFFRALQHDPEGVAQWADYPVSELDLHARHRWLVTSEESTRFRETMRRDPDFYDVKFAGYWVWGISCWIGSGWCAGAATEKLPHLSDAGPGVNSSQVVGAFQRPHLGDAGEVLHRQSLHAKQSLPSLGDGGRFPCRQGLYEKKPTLHSGGKGLSRQSLTKSDGLYSYLQELSARLRRVRVCCGDWSRVLGPSVTEKLGATAVFLDPPYGEESQRHTSLYAYESQSVASEVRKWAIEHGNNPLYRIALCGYLEEHEKHIPANWERFLWKANGGYGTQGGEKSRGMVNRSREVIWFSPHCHKVGFDLFSAEEETLF